MELPSNKVCEILKARDVNVIYHANSVITSCQFLRNKALLSRGVVEKSGFFQSTQQSDDIDKEYGVWFDIFADSSDIHNRANRANVYGPVLFELDIEILNCVSSHQVWITKLNPTKWAEDLEHENKWFISIDDLDTNFSYGDFNQMIVFRHNGGELPISNYLNKIILDDPDLQSDNIDCYSMAFGALYSAMAEGGIDASIEKRVCNLGCSCKQDYKAKKVDPNKMFIPKI